MNYIYLENLKNEFEIELKTAHPKIKDFWDDLFTRLDFIEDPELLPEIHYIGVSTNCRVYSFYSYQIIFTKMINTTKVALFMIQFDFSFYRDMLEVKFFKHSPLPDYCKELEKEIKEKVHRITATDDSIKSEAWNVILKAVKILNEINK